MKKAPSPHSQLQYLMCASHWEQVTMKWLTYGLLLEQTTFSCACPDGYTGDNCQYQGEDSERLQNLYCQGDTNPCLNDARCLKVENETICVCR